MSSFNRGRKHGPNDNNGDSKLPGHRPTIEINEPRCNVCKSKWRRTIDQMIVMGVSIAELARQFESENLTRKSISNHKNRHLSVEEAAIRQIIEERAVQFGEDIDNAKKIHLTRKGVLEVAMLKSYGGILEGTVSVEARDLVAIIQQLEKMDEMSGTVQFEEATRQLHALLDAVKKIVPEAMWHQIVHEFERKLDTEKAIVSYGVELPDLPELPDVGYMYDEGNDDEG